MQISKEHLKILDIIIKMGMDNASRRFSKTIKHAALIELVKTELVDISEITEEMNKDLREMVASMLRLEGSFSGKLLFMIPLLQSHLFFRKIILSGTESKPKASLN